MYFFDPDFLLTKHNTTTMITIVVAIRRVTATAVTTMYTTVMREESVSVKISVAMEEVAVEIKIFPVSIKMLIKK